VRLHEVYHRELGVQQTVDHRVERETQRESTARNETRQRYGVLVDDGRPGAQSTPFDVARRQPVRVPRSEDRGQNPRRDQVRDCPPVGRRAVSSRRHHHSPTYHFPDVQVRLLQAKPPLLSPRTAAPPQRLSRRRSSVIPGSYNTALYERA
jgi:hypothetical protein